MRRPYYWVQNTLFLHQLICNYLLTNAKKHLAPGDRCCLAWAVLPPDVLLFPKGNRGRELDDGHSHIRPLLYLLNNIDL